MKQNILSQITAALQNEQQCELGLCNQGIDNKLLKDISSTITKNGIAASDIVIDLSNNKFTNAGSIHVLSCIKNYISTHYKDEKTKLYIDLSNNPIGQISYNYVRRILDELKSKLSEAVVKINDQQTIIYQQGSEINELPKSNAIKSNQNNYGSLDGNIIWEYNKETSPSKGISPSKETSPSKVSPEYVITYSENIDGIRNLDYFKQSPSISIEFIDGDDKKISDDVINYQVKAKQHTPKRVYNGVSPIDTKLVESQQEMKISETMDGISPISTGSSNKNYISSNSNSPESTKLQQGVKEIEETINNSPNPEENIQDKIVEEQIVNNDEIQKKSLLDNTESVPQEKEVPSSEVPTKMGEDNIIPMNVKIQYVLQYANIALKITDMGIDASRAIMFPTEANKITFLTDLIQSVGFFGFGGYSITASAIWVGNMLDIAYDFYSKKDHYEIEDFYEPALKIMQSAALTAVLPVLISKSPLALTLALTSLHFYKVAQNAKDFYGEWQEFQSQEQIPCGSCPNKSIGEILGEMGADPSEL